MSRIRFNHVFTALLLAGLVSAFIFPERTSGIRAGVQGVFYPVARPARALASALRGPFDRPVERRADKDIAAENHRLRAAVASLTGQLEELRQIAAERAQFGDVGRHCTPVAVMGNDPKSRDSLSVHGPFDSRLLGQPVLYVGGLAGTIERAGAGGAQVRLVTDRSFSALARVGTFGADVYGEIRFRSPDALPPAMVEGMGDGVMIIRNIQYKDAAEHVPVGAWVVLDDKDYPLLLTHQKIGRVISVQKRSDAPLRAEIKVRPEWNLMALREVMVLGRTAPAQQHASTD